MTKETTSKDNRGSIKALRWLSLPAIIAFVLAYNFFWMHFPVQQKLSEDYRNTSASIAVYHRWGIHPNEIVVDIRSVEGSASRLDITRMLFQIAEVFEDRNYSTVILAHRGKEKLKLDGDFFKETGETFSFQNPIHLSRELPKNVYHLDGKRAYGSYSGGWLGVLNAELEQLNDLHDDWWLDAELSGL